MPQLLWLELPAAPPQHSGFLLLNESRCISVQLSLTLSGSLVASIKGSHPVIPCPLGSKMGCLCTGRPSRRHLGGVFIPAPSCHSLHVAGGLVLHGWERLGGSHLSWALAVLGTPLCVFHLMPLFCSEIHPGAPLGLPSIVFMAGTI